MVLVEEARRAGDTVLLSQRPGERASRRCASRSSTRRRSSSATARCRRPRTPRCGSARGGRFVVTDPGLLEAGWPAELIAQLRAAGLTPVVWNDVTPNPKDHEIEAGHERYREAGCDVVLGIGGGSVIDAAKGVALLAANGGRILDYEGIDRIEHPIPPLIMMPSTSGTGADVSQFCIVTDTVRHTKITIMGRALVPDVSVIDPRLLTTMPPRWAPPPGSTRSPTASRRSSRSAHGPLTDNHALQAIAMVNGNLARTIHRPDDTAARACMAQAALEAGLAFTNAILGATHAMSHQVGGMLDLPHGVVNGVLLPHVIRFNGAELPERFVPIAQAMGACRGGRAAGRGRRAGGRRGARARRRGRRAPRARRPRRARGGHPAPVGAHPLRRVPHHQPAADVGRRRHGDVPSGTVSGNVPEHRFRSRGQP